MHKYKIIIAGCGSMAQVWADYAISRNDSIIVGLVDINVDSAYSFAQKKQLNCPIFTTIKEAIEQTNANLVFDITIPASHYEIASTAMALGCDVFSEKPLADTLEQCLALVHQSKSLGRTHAIMQNRRFDPRIRTLRKMINEGTIGTLGFTGADFFIGPHFGGFRDAMNSPLLLDMAIHTFDQARFIMNANPVSVYCHEYNPSGSWYKGNAMALCIFEMSDGSVFDFRGSWCSEGAPTSWEASWRVVGDEGTIIWDGHQLPYAEIIKQTNEPQKFVNDFTRVDAEQFDMPLTFHHGCLEHLFDSLEKGVTPETASHDNIHSMIMVLAALESAKLGKKVDISGFIDQFSIKS